MQAGGRKVATVEQAAQILGLDQFKPQTAAAAAMHAPLS